MLLSRQAADGPWSSRLLRVPLAIVLTSWALFGLGAAIEYGSSLMNRGPVAQGIVLCLGIAPLIVAGVVYDKRRRWGPFVAALLDEHTANIDRLPAALDGLWIALAAGIGLYLELALIRFHASCFQLFAFFKNLSLLSCFLGLGIGYMLGTRRPLFTPLVLPALAIQLVLMHCLRFTAIAQTLHNPILEQSALGLEPAIDRYHILTAYSLLICVFSFNALSFIPLGHLASYLMARTTRLVGYSWNLLGSLGGILLFYALSFAWMPPAVWIGAGVLVLTVFLVGNRKIAAGAGAIGVVLVAVLAVSFRTDQYDIYSPYQILTLNLSKSAHPLLSVNHVYFQKILDLSASEVRAGAGDDTIRAANYYSLPYAFKPRPADVLIVGAGTGNDVAAAVRNGAGHIDAVEIDPAILQLGKSLHPEAPYQVDNVTPHVQDARAFIRWTDKKYDLIVYGLLDSHTLVSSAAGGVRLDSYIYTVQAMREARAHLKEGGVICLTFCMIRGEMGRKLYLMLKDAFDGQPPVAYWTNYDGGYSFVIGRDVPPSAFNVDVPGIKLATDEFSGEKYHADPSTDDWPFFYMPVRKYPLSYAAMILLVMATAVLFVRPFAAVAPASSGGFSLPCFLLGAGFMLLETKAITELALFYGSTWVVTAIVITAILIMAFLANLFLIYAGSVRLPLAYGLLLATLGLSLALTYTPLAGWGLWAGRVLATSVVTLPLFFAGLVFSSELQRASSVGAALGANLIGAMLGGCLEYNSMYFGYRSLYVVALLIYAMALVSSMMLKPGASSPAAPQPAPKQRLAKAAAR